jgi:hypothetical protein
MKKFSLPLTKQCKNCPWKESVNPADIPNGFDYKSHKKLIESQPKEFEITDKLSVMACHNSNDNDQMFCVGYLHNQLGVGNNISLRLKMLFCDNVSEIEVYGKQRKSLTEVKPIKK